MGYLRKRGKKKYQIVIELEPDPDGTRNHIYKTVNCTKPKLIADYYDYKLEEGNLVTGEGLSNRTVRYHHSILKRAFHVAIKWRRLKINPADLVDQPEKIDKEAEYLTAQQLNIILEYENIDYSKQIYNFAAQTS